jgi:hypothetical protein
MFTTRLKTPSFQLNGQKPAMMHNDPTTKSQFGLMNGDLILSGGDVKI